MKNQNASTSSRALLLGLVLLSLITAWSSEGRDMNAFFTNNCAACHGVNLQGGSAPSLLTNKWKHGADDLSIARVIRDGDVPKGMPAWGAALSEAEIRALVVLLREKVSKAESLTNVVAKPIDGEIVSSKEHKFRFKTVAENLETPWSVAFLPDGRMLVTELPGRLRVVENGKLQSTPVSGTPTVRAKGQGGLMEVAVHPGWKTNGWVYLAYAEPLMREGKELGMTTIVRGRIQDGAWTDQQEIFRARPEHFSDANHHFGCRMVFDKSGHLYFSIGERGVKQHAQDNTRPNGKVHRVRDDGKIPADNPFVGQSNAIPSIWSLGNRNAQGLVIHPQTGDLWETEHGARGGDELNIIQRGRNYGWPEITHGMDYNGSPITAFTAKEGMEQPVIHWTPSIAVCGMDFYFGKPFDRWQGNIFVTGLAQQELRRIVLDGQSVTSQEIIFKNIGRVRDVCAGPDGMIYVALNKPDKVIRLEPVN